MNKSTFEKMKRVIYYIFLVLVIISCDNKTKHNQTSIHLKSDVKLTDSVSQTTDKDRFSVRDLTRIIDSIYQDNINELDSVRIDTFKTFFECYNDDLEILSDDSVIQQNPEITRVKFLKHPLFAFSPQNAKYLYEFGSFSILTFDNDSLAKGAFQKVFSVFVKGGNEFIYTEDSVKMFYDIFSKAGCSYFYKKNYIIHKYRECSEDYREQSEKDDALIECLYNNRLPKNGSYFMRYCCSCPDHMSVDYR